MITQDFQPDDDDALRALAGDCGMAFSGDIPTPDPTLISTFPASLARRHHSLPVSRTPFGISVHIPDPLDFESIDALRHMLGEAISPVVTPKEIIDKAIDEIYK